MHLRKPDQDTEGRLAEALNNPVVTENAYQTQVRNLREQAKNDPNYFYTYSPEFMSLSVDPYNIAEVKRQNDEDHKSKFTVKEGFHNVIKRDFKMQRKQTSRRSSVSAWRKRVSIPRRAVSPWANS